MTRAEPVSGGRALLAAALVAIAVLAGVWTLRPLIAPGPWLGVSALFVVGLAVLTATLRRASRSPTAASMVGLAVGAVGLGTVYAGPGTGPSLFVPTPDSLDRFSRLVGSGIDQVADGYIPVEPSRGIELLVVAGATLAFLAMELLAVGLGRAGLSGVVLVALWSPSAVFERTLSLPVLLVGGVTYLLLLAAVRPTTDRPSGSPPRLAATATAAAGLVTVIAVAAGPALAAVPFFGAVRLPSTWGATSADGPLRLSTDLDMRSSLDERSDRTILTYTTQDARRLGPLRMYTVSDFDGTQWQRDERPGDLEGLGGVLWPEPVPTPPPPTDEDEGGRAQTDSTLVEVTIGDLDQDRLPISIDPREIRVDGRGRWLYDATRDEVVTARAGTTDLSYAMRVTSRDLDPDVLRADAPGDHFGPASPFLALPESAFESEIRALALEITAEATTTYDRAMALQSHFRDMQNFRYSTEVPAAQTDDAVWDFLTQRTGYCVQYATAMTIMARTLDIPARVGIGFLPGTVSPDRRGEFVVSGRQAHAWPEIYFADAGWVRFEPTPATQTGAPPLYADPNAGLPVPFSDLPTASAEPFVTPQATTPAEVQAGSGGRVGIGTASAPMAVLVLGAVVVLVVVALAAERRRRRSRRRPPPDAEAWWGVLERRLAAHDVRWSPATTPRQAAELLRERYESAALAGTASVDATLEASDAVGYLAGAVERQRYAPEPEPISLEVLEAWVDAAERPFVPTGSAGPGSRRAQHAASAH